MFAFGAGLLVQGAAARCCCRVPLLVLLRWQASPGSRAQGFFSFSLLVFRPKRALVGWYAFKPRFGLVLAAFLFAYAMAHCFVDFRRCIQRKKCMLTARAQCFLHSSHLLWFAEFTGAHNESLQKTMLVMWLQRRDAPSVFHSACHTRCEKYGIPNSNRLIIIDFPQFNWSDVQMYTIFGQISTSYCCTMITLLHVSLSHITSHILYKYIYI